MRNDKTKSVCLVTGSGSLNVKAGNSFAMRYVKDGADAATVYNVNVREVFAQFFVADTDKGVRSFRYDRIAGRA